MPTRVASVKLLLNLILLVFGGLVTAVGYALVALVMFVLIITIPFGIASAGSRCSACGHSGGRLFAVRTPAPARLSET